ncbi:sugar phosphate nucleotidyltransferase [Acidobacteria bacterium AH-259-A15]|nr:sugar phosphate nucleotidyltransferase [Acidobacteria bacterium AH-259-A15]
MLRGVLVLAAGKSTRTYPLTQKTPKPLLQVCSKTLLQRVLEGVDSYTEKIFVVTGFAGELIEAHVGSLSLKASIQFVHQKEQRGTGDAIRCCASLIQGPCAVLMGSNYYPEHVFPCLQRNAPLIVACKGQNLPNLGKIDAEDASLSSIKGKPSLGSHGLTNTGFYVLSEDFLPQLAALAPSVRGELELTDAISTYAKHTKLAIHMVEGWTPITYGWHLLDVVDLLLAHLPARTEGAIEEGVVLKGQVHVGAESLVRSGAYIEGPMWIGRHCAIGPNCYLRGPTSIGDHCKVGNAVEIKHTVLQDYVSVGHLCYIGDSVIGRQTNIGAGTITANLRHDGLPIRTPINGVMVNTGRRKFGTLIGEGAHVGIHTTIYPGRKIASGKMTLPGQIVKEDVV